jgi:type I restriction enzyme M protein
LAQIRLNGSTLLVDKKTEIMDYISGKNLRATPEERVRQIMAQRLVEEYGYSPKQIQTVPEFHIAKGSKKIGPADIVVFYNDHKTQDNIYFIIETKREERTDGIEQLKSYLSPTMAEFGIWFNGKEIVYVQSLRKKPFFREIADIPKKGETLEDIGLYQKRNLVPASELKTIFEVCHNYIYANEGLLKEKVFNEFLKLIFIKMVDEKSLNQKCQFRITDRELEEIENGVPNDFLGRIQALFQKVKEQYRDVFRDNAEEINLKPLTVAVIVSRLQKYSLIDTPADVKGTAFQTFVHAHERGERGEFFTPFPILQLAVKMLDPKEDERILDPACGSGGFLVQAMKHVFGKIDESRPDLQEASRNQIKEKYAHTFIRGIDINPDLARVAKMHMIIYDDGHTGIFSTSSLESFDKIREAALLAHAGDITEAYFRSILTNPPFGTKGKIASKDILEQFDLAHRWKEDRATGNIVMTTVLFESQVPDVLFIERCLGFLEDYGRLAIVVPDGILTNSSLNYVREYIKKSARIIAIVSLPQETFVPHGAGSKTSVLFLQKLPKEELFRIKEQDYPIFMAICEKIGYDIRGRTIYKKNDQGQLINEQDKVVNNQDEAAIDTDIPEIIEAFAEFKRINHLDF